MALQMKTSNNRLRRPFRNRIAVVRNSPLDPPLQVLNGSPVAVTPSVNRMI